MANRIKKGDHVIVIAGKDKGKRGDVVRVVLLFIEGLRDGARLR